MSLIRVVLVDDHRMVRVGLRAMLETAADISVVGEAEDGAQAVTLISELDGLTAQGAPQVDVVLMDLSMPVLDGVEATRRILADQPKLRIVVLSSSTEQQRVRDALNAGAIGYTVKDCEPEQLIAAVRSAAAGHSPLDPRVAGALLPNSVNTEPTLSEREREVLRLAATGLANKQIGRSLGISEHTVKVHLGNIFRRIGVSDRTSAALWARDHLEQL